MTGIHAERVPAWLSAAIIFRPVANHRVNVLIYISLFFADFFAVNSGRNIALRVGALHNVTPVTPHGPGVAQNCNMGRVTPRAGPIRWQNRVAIMQKIYAAARRVNPGEN